MPSLTEAALKALKPRAALYRVADGDGLCVEITPGGSKLWRFRYRFNGKASMLSLGAYPERSLRDARLALAEARRVVGEGRDPAAIRAEIKAQSAEASANTFGAVAREWLAKQHLAEVTRGKHQWMLADLIGPWLGERPVSEIKAAELLAVLRRIESRGKLETAQRTKQLCGRVFRYAIATGRAEVDPAAALTGALRTPKTEHHASVTDPAKIGPLLRAIHGYAGTLPVACAFKLAPLLFVRPGELRHAEWSEIDFDAAEWRIPAEKMKMRAAHVVPLSAQALAILRELQPLTSRSRYVFPSVKSAHKPMSEATLMAALRAIGYGGQMSWHGFRSLASTRLHELGWPHDAIERQLAHAERNKVSAAYNYAEHLPERRKMMQAWSDYLDRLREGGNVVAGKFGRVA